MIRILYLRFQRYMARRARQRIAKAARHLSAVAHLSDRARRDQTHAKLASELGRPWPVRGQG